MKNKLIKFLEERHSKLDKFIKYLEEKKEDIEKNKKEIDKFINELNKDEYDYEIDMLINNVYKIHCIFLLGIDTIKKCKDINIKILNEKKASLPSFLKSRIESQIKEIIDSTPIKFLDSTFGKPIKTVLEKYGLSRAFLNSLKGDLLKERKERWEKERKDFSLEENTFGDEDNILKVDFYKFVTEELEDEDFQEKFKKEILSLKLV